MVGYVGPRGLDPVSVVRTKATGDASTTVFGLGFTPADEASVRVIIDNQVVMDDGYSVSGSDITFATAPANNAKIEFFGASVQTTFQPTEASVGSRELQAGSIVDESYAELVTYGSLGTATIPQDDTLPQITEGNQVMTLAHAAKNDNNILLINYQFMGSHSAAGAWMILPLFIQGENDALSVAVERFNTAGQLHTHQGFLRYSPGNTTSNTYEMRIGSNGAGTVYRNGSASARLLGGVSKCFIHILEIKG